MNHEAKRGARELILRRYDAAPSWSKEIMASLSGGCADPASPRCLTVTPNRGNERSSVAVDFHGKRYLHMVVRTNFNSRLSYRRGVAGSGSRTLP